LVADASGAIRIVPRAELAELFSPGDLVVVNDAATLPASLFADTAAHARVELRLVSFRGATTTEVAWTVVLLGAGDYRTRTEDRPPPPPVALGERLVIAKDLVATVVAVRLESPRMVDVSFSASAGGIEEGGPADVWAALYREGRPVQYAHVPEPLALWDVQNVYAARPWAVEMPSAGRAVRGDTLARLRQRGVDVASVTHAAGLSSVGEPSLDARLPLPERYEVPDATWEAAARARAAGGRVIAIGTSVVRALEGAARAGQSSGITDLRIGPRTRRVVVDAILTGVHDVETSHFDLLGSFASREVLDRMVARAEAAGLFGHELGDACLVWGQPRENLRRSPASSAQTLSACYLHAD
jgi:S-adenosylmethionine:tRNA ribosyltransferase-isomerase